MKENFKKYLANYGLYFGLIAAFILAAFIIFNFDLPKIEEISSIREQLNGAKEKLNKLQTKVNILSEVNVPRLNRDIDNVNLILPDGKDAPGILRNLESAAAGSGATITEMDLVPGKVATPSAKQDKAIELPIKVSLKGDITAVSNFLSRMANTGRVIDLRNLDISFSDESSTSSVNATLDLLALSMKSLEASVSSKMLYQPLSVLGVLEKTVLDYLSKRYLLPPQESGTSSSKLDLFK